MTKEIQMLKCLKIWILSLFMGETPKQSISPMMDSVEMDRVGGDSATGRETM
jgi:hypothetical protein